MALPLYDPALPASPQAALTITVAAINHAEIHRFERSPYASLRPKRCVRGERTNDRYISLYLFYGGNVPPCRQFSHLSIVGRSCRRLPVPVARCQQRPRNRPNCIVPTGLVTHGIWHDSRFCLCKSKSFNWLQRRTVVPSSLQIWHDGPRSRARGDAGCVCVSAMQPILQKGV